MIPKIGQTISAEEFNRLPDVGETISAEQFDSMFSETATPPTQGGFFAPTPTGESPYETGSVLTSPITSYQPSQDESISGAFKQGLKIAGQGLANVPTSAARLAKAAVDPRTYVNLGRTLAGGIQSAPVVKNLFDKLVTTEKGKEVLQTNRDAFGGFVEGLKDQYGTAENIKRSLAEDPIGTILIARGLFEGGVKFSQKLKGIEPKPKTPTTKTVAPFKESYKPEVAKEFAEVGVKAPVSAVTTSKFVQLGESLTGKSPFGTKIVQIVNEAKTALENKTNEVINRIKPVKTISEENLGKTLQEGLAEYESNFKKTQSGIYDEFGKKYNKSPATADNTLKTINDVVTEQSQSLYGKIDPEVLKLRNQLNIPRKIPGGTMAEPRPGLTFENLKSTRTSVGEALSKDPSNSALRRIYGALSEDMNTTIKNTDPFSGGELQKISDNYKAGKQKIESQISQSIEKSNPERIAQNIIKRNSADTLKTVKEVVGPERFNEISKSFIRQMFEQSETRGKFDVEKFKNNLGKYDNETLREILSPEQKSMLDGAVSELEKLQRLQNALKPGEKFSEGSQTAYLQQVAIIPAKVSALVTAFWTGNWALAAGVIFETLGELGASKFYTTDIGRKLLTEGVQFNIPSPPKGASLPFMAGKLEQGQSNNR